MQPFPAPRKRGSLMKDCNLLPKNVVDILSSDDEHVPALSQKKIESYDETKNNPDAVLFHKNI